MKYFMFALVLAFTLSEFILKDFPGKGWEDRAAHLVGYAVCAVIPQFSRCFDRTIADLNEAIRENPRNPAILVDRGNAYFGHGEFDRAVEDFDEAIRLSPELAVAYARRAYAYRAEGNDDRAISDIQQASKLDSQFASAASEMMRLAQAIKEEQEKNRARKITRERSRRSRGPAWACAHLSLRWRYRRRKVGITPGGGAQ